MTENDYYNSIFEQKYNEFLSMGQDEEEAEENANDCVIALWDISH